MFVSVSCRGLAQLYVCVCMMPRPGITQLYVCVCSMPWSGLTQLYACVCFMPQNYPAVCLCLYHAADKPSRMFVSVSGCGLLSCMFVSVPCLGLTQLYVCICTMPRPGLSQLYVCVCTMPWSVLTKLYVCVCTMSRINPAVCLCLYHAAD